MRSCGYGYSCGSDFESYSLHAWLRCFSLPRGANSTAVTEIDRLTFLHHEMETMTNTDEEQYRRAPLNGLATGAIVGAVWALVILAARSSFGRYAVMALTLFAIVLPVVGWFAGVWAKTGYTGRIMASRQRRVKIIGAVIATVTGLALTGMIHGFTDRPGNSPVPNGQFLSLTAFVWYLAPVIVFPPAGWILAGLRITLTQRDSHIVPLMAGASVVGLIICGYLWFAITGILPMFLFPFSA